MTYLSPHAFSRAVVSVLIIFVTTSCAQEKPKEDSPDEVVGQPPSQTDPSGPRAKMISQPDIESPTGPCDKLWAKSETRAAKCTDDLIVELLINQNRQAVAAIWPRAEIVVQTTSRSGETKTDRMTGEQYSTMILSVLSRPNSSTMLSAMLAADTTTRDFELLSDGSVRASYSDDRMKSNNYYSSINGEMRLVRATLVLY